MPQSFLFLRRPAVQLALLFACAALCVGASAQQDKNAPALPSVTIAAKANRDPVEKSYRKMIRGMDLFFEKQRSMSPNGLLRFKLLPRKRETDMNSIVLEVIGSSVDFQVPIAPPAP